MSILEHQPVSKVSSAAGVRERIPPLSQGDRLSRAEFLERYALLPEHVKAERIEGRVYMPASAVSADFHGVPHANILTWLGNYKAFTPGVQLADNSTLALDLDNDPQPDACLYVLPSHGGRCKSSSNGIILGAPELIVEIAASTVSFDLGAKLDAYRRNGVREYLVHRTYDGEFDWFVLRDSKYIRLAQGSDEIFRSEAFPGLWLSTIALIEGRLADVLTTLQTGIASTDHVSFAAALEASRQHVKPD